VDSHRPWGVLDSIVNRSNQKGCRVSGTGTRIASISGVQGVVGDGLDPATAVEFASASAGACEPGPIVVGHDGRVSSAVFAAAVEAGVTATGHDALLVGPTATPTIGWLVREAQSAGGIQISASHNPPQYNGLKFFQRGGMVLGASQGRALLDAMLTQQATVIAYDNTFKLLMVLTVIALPLVAVTRPARAASTDARYPSSSASLSLLRRASACSSGSATSIGSSNIRPP